MKKLLSIVIVAVLMLSMFSMLSPQVKPSSGVAPEVVCVPFHGKHLGVPHDTWIGKEIVLKGTAHDSDGDTTLKSYKWDFGDGYSTGWITGVNPYAIEAKHTYTGTMADGTTYGPGKFFTAWLHVEDNEVNIGKDSYFIAIRDISDPKKKLEIEVNVAIDNGLWWLHKTQIRYSSSGTDYGYWRDSSYGSYITGPTSTAVLSFEIHGHVPTGDRGEDPYVETVQRGLSYVFTQCYSRSISGPSPSCPYGDPDTNGNGIGVDVSSGRRVYEIGMVMMAIAASGDPNLIATTGGVAGRTYFDILTDMVDMCAWGQNQAGSGRGGWRYDWNYGNSDNSVTQWPIIGLEAAETNWGILAPAFVKSELDLWLAYSQNTNGGFGYTSPWEWVNVAKTGAGLCGLAYIELPPTDTRVTNAINYLNARWGAGGTDGYWGNYYALYAVMKGCRLFDPEIEYIGSHNWYWHDPDGFARYLVNQQRSDGKWPAGVYGGDILDTGWAMLALTPTVTYGPPVADAGSDVDNHPPEPVSVTFDASGSYHTDPTKNIVLYEWDFEGDGVWDYSSTDIKVEHAYPAYKNPDGSIDWDKTAKDYTATLRVTDNNDPPLQDKDTCVIRITPPPWKPVADPDGPYRAVTGIALQLDGSKSYDPESRMYAETHPWYETIEKYEWDLDNDGQFDDSPETQPSWIWNSEGTYSVGLKVTDSQPSGPGGTVGPLDVAAKYVIVTVSDYAESLIITNKQKLLEFGVEGGLSGDQSKEKVEKLLITAKLLHPASITCQLENELSDPDNWEQIDKFVEDMWAKFRFDHLVILGPPDVVPFCITDDPTVDLPFQHTNEGTIRTDFHYGEINGDDYQDLAVGRIVGKTIDDMILLMKPLTEQSIGEAGVIGACNEWQDCGNHIYNQLTDTAELAVVKLYQGDTLSRENFRKELQNKGVITWLGHSSEYVWVYAKKKQEEVALNHADVRDVGLGGTTPIVVAIGCWSASLPVLVHLAWCIPTSFIHKGASCFIGSTAYEWAGRWGNAYSEKLAKYFFNHLIAGEDIGTAFKNAKREYVDKDLKDIWGDPWGRDRKTLLEFVLYGDPLFNPTFPNEASTKMSLRNKLTSRKIASSIKESIDITEFYHSTIDDFDLIEIPGAELHVEHGYPIIPMITKRYTIPADEEFAGVNLIDANGEILSGTFKLPIGQAWSIMPTTETELYVAGSYPGTLYKISVFQELDGTKTLILTVAPLHYDKRTGEVFLYRHIELEIIAEPSTIDMIPSDWEILEPMLPTESISQAFSIRNTANLPVTGIDITAQGDIEAWLTFNLTEIDELQPGESKGLEAYLTIPQQVSFGFYSGCITLTSNSGSQSVPVYVSIGVNWEYQFEDSTRQTILRVSASKEYFQFAAPDKEFSPKHDLDMRITCKAIIIIYEDWEIKIVTVDVDTGLDFCIAVAWDQQTRKRYMLLDKPGIE
ncbi:MAG: C25 family cysteine peptidase [Candidatus Bathyarchaeota archaeon]|nr:C25 family cysteine peptidase [Candidatus Bathyarchaeota archaeon]MDH5745426.1 C25 family cysteine peptidase [Candidatus Bathyarchaeota archaeon]